MRRSCSVAERGDLPLRGLVQEGDQLRVHRHHHARPAGLGVQPPGDREHGVADLLGRQSPPARSARAGGSPGRARPASAADRGPAGLAVGAAEDHQPVDRLQPPAPLDQRAASQSSSSGWLGRSPLVPKSLTVLTSPTPKWCCQSRLTRTLAVSGCSGETSQRASRVRGSGRSAGSSGSSSGTRMLGGRGPTGSPLFSQIAAPQDVDRRPLRGSHSGSPGSSGAWAASRRPAPRSPPSAASSPRRRPSGPASGAWRSCP